MPADAAQSTPGPGRSAQSPDEGSHPSMSGESRSFWRRNRKRTLSAVVGALVTAGFFYFVVPRIVGLGPTLRALRSGDVGWLLLGVVVEACSMAGDIVTFQGVFAARGTPTGWRRTADLRLAGAAATKLLAAAGAGGSRSRYGLCAVGACPARMWRTEWRATRSSPTGFT